MLHFQSYSPEKGNISSPFNNANRKIIPQKRAPCFYLSLNSSSYSPSTVKLDYCWKHDVCFPAWSSDEVKLLCIREEKSST